MDEKNFATLSVSAKHSEGCETSTFLAYVATNNDYEVIQSDSLAWSWGEGSD